MAGKCRNGNAAQEMQGWKMRKSEYGIESEQTVLALCLAALVTSL